MTNLVRIWIVAPDGQIENTTMLPAGAAIDLPPGYSLTTIEPPAVAPALPVPASVPRWKARAAMRMAGVLDAAEAAIAAADPVTQEWWAAGVEIERAHPRVVEIGQALGLIEAELDDLFRIADSITA